MKGKRWMIIAVFMGVAMLIAPAGSFSAETIKIGVLLPLTGPLAPIGQYCWTAKVIAQKEINESGGIKSMGGAKIELVKADTEGKPEVAMGQTEKVIRDGAVVLLGAYQSNVTYAISAIAEKYKIPLITGISVADNITQRGFKYIFRVNVTATTLGEDIFRNIQLLEKKTVKKVETTAVISENTLFGKSQTEGVEKAAKKFGYKNLGSILYPTNTSEITAEITKLKSLNPDMLIGISYISDAILIFKTMAEHKLNVKGVIGVSGGYGEPEFVNTLGKLAEYTFCTGNWQDDIKKPHVKEVAARHLKEFNTPMSPQGACTYTAVYVLKDALERARSTNGEKLREAIAKTDLKNNDIIMPYNGVRFNDQGDNVAAHQTLMQIQGGKYRTVIPDEYASVAPIFPVPKWENR